MQSDLKQHTMTRRTAMLSATASTLFLGGCFGDSATVRFRVIAMAEVEGQPVEGSSVMEIRFQKGAGPRSVRTFGEAVILDLKGRGTVFVLPIELQQGTPAGVYHYAIMKFVNIAVGGVGAMTSPDFRLMRNARGRRPFNEIYPQGRLPLIVAFRDERNPNSIFEVPPSAFPSVFGAGAKFRGIDIEITDEPVTKQLQNRLKWLDRDNPLSGFERDPPGKQRSDRDTPLNRKFGYNEFILGDLY